MTGCGRVRVEERAAEGNDPHGGDGYFVKEIGRVVQ